MASKSFPLTDDVSVTIVKRRASRSLRLSINASGEVRVSLPPWLPYKAGLVFAQSRLDWIIAQRPLVNPFKDGQTIGKQHHLQLKINVSATTVTTRVQRDRVVVTHPLRMKPEAPEVQMAIQRAAIRAIRQEATALLPPRLTLLAEQHGFSYNGVAIKQLTSRWGSCDQNKNIALNLFLMQLPPELIDYVLLHELSHTRHLNHGSDFWELLESVLPGARIKRLAIKQYKPVVNRLSTL